MPSRSTFSRNLIANETVAGWLAALGITPSSFQPVDATLTALAAYNTNGILAQTAADTFTGRTITGSGGVAVTNGDGVAGAPALTLDIAGLTADASPDSANDYAVTYDASATANKKVLLSNLVPAAVSAAAQSDQETSTSTTTYVSPGRQQFHPSAAKCWAYVTVSGGTPTLAASYNITSITDTGDGILTITIATDFSSANWCASVGMRKGGAGMVWVSAQAAGSVEISAADNSGTPGDPLAYNFVGFGDQ